MKAICYENTHTSLPGSINSVHVEQKFGYAYETDTHFVHFYGKKPYYIISVGLTVTEKKTGKLEDWVVKRFGAKNIQQMKLDVGHTIDGIWRPSLYYWEDTCVAIRIRSEEQLSEEHALRILVSQLDSLLLFIEPSSNGLESYSHKTRELLILACTEIENQWRALLQRANAKPTNGKEYTTQDYVKLITPTHLQDYSVQLRSLSYSSDISPFKSWSPQTPTQSLEWYDAYNKTKHDREGYFNVAKLRYVIDALAANLIFYAIRFSPLTLTNNTNAFSGIINQMFNIHVNNSDRTSFYLPHIDTSKITNPDCICFDSYKEKFNKDWVVDILVL